MDATLAEAVAKRIATWIDESARTRQDCNYYRGLVVRCGNALGEVAHICDSGSRSEDVLCAKVPELVEALSNEFSRLDAMWQGLVKERDALKVKVEELEAQHKDCLEQKEALRERCERIELKTNSAQEAHCYGRGLIGG